VQYNPLRRLEENWSCRGGTRRLVLMRTDAALGGRLVISSVDRVPDGVSRVHTSAAQCEGRLAGPSERMSECGRLNLGTQPPCDF
jgi:hypothetical protein